MTRAFRQVAVFYPKETLFRSVSSERLQPQVVAWRCRRATKIPGATLARTAVGVTAPSFPTGMKERLADPIRLFINMLLCP